MSDDIKKILARLDEALTPVSVKKGLNPQQRSVPQLSADFTPKTIRALGAPTDPQHPMAGRAVGASESRTPTPAKTRNPVAKNAPRSGAGQHRDRRRAERHGEVKHKKSATANDEIKESQHRPEQAVMILRRIPEGYRGARLYEKIMNTIIKRLGPAGPGAERREFYQTLAADVMERYIQKFPASAAMREDRAQDIKMSDAIDAMINGLETAKIYVMVPGGQDRSRRYRTVELLANIRQQFLETFQRRERAQWLDDFLTPLDWCADTLSSGAWNPEAMIQTLDICIALLNEKNDQLISQREPDDEGGISIGDLSEDYDDDDDEEDQEDAGFFVVIANEDDGVFIGYVTKEDGRWYERRVSGQPPYAWGGPKYMSYLTPRDVMNWIRRDFERHYEVKGPFADEESARDYAEQFLGEGVSESTYHISDFKINAYESMADFRKWMRSPKINDRGMTRHVVDIYENIVVDSNRLTEASEIFQKRKQQANQFSEKFKQFDQRDQVQIKVGNKIALLSTTAVPDDKSSRIELSGFTTPKKIAKINLDGQGQIDSIKFDDGTVFPEAAEFTTVGGVNITNTIFFPTSASASKAYTAIWMYISNLQGKGWKVERYMSEGVSEGTLKESGETYTWTAHFADCTTNQMNIATDEVPYAREAFAMKFPGRDIARVTTDWKVAGGQHAHGAVTARPDRRPTEPRGRDVDNPMVREQSLAEAMAEIEEDMLSKVRNDLTRYLDRLENKVKKDKSLSQKEPRVEEDPTAVDTMTVPPPAPVQDPVMPESAPVKSVTLEDGCVLEIHGDQRRGFEIRRSGRSLPTRFPNLDHAQMAVDLYRQRRGAGDGSADYVEER